MPAAKQLTMLLAVLWTRLAKNQKHHETIALNASNLLLKNYFESRWLTAKKLQNKEEFFCVARTFLRQLKLLIDENNVR